MTMNHLDISRFGRALLPVILCTGLFVSSANRCSAQNTADQLYQSVQQLQNSLEDGEPGDRIRDEYLIRELETEAARGFPANPGQFSQSLARLNAADSLSPELEAVRDALAGHLAVLQAAEAADLNRFLDELGNDLPTVPLESLEASRNALVGALESLDARNVEELSDYGRFYFNRVTGLPQLVKRLDNLNFQVLDISLPEGIELDLPMADEESEAQSQQDLNRDLNQLRGELREARNRLAIQSPDYPSPQMLATEYGIRSFEDQVTAYLLAQTTRALQAFRNDQQLRNRVFADQQPDSRMYQAELGRLLGLLNDRNQQAGVDAAARQRFSHPNLKVSIHEGVANQLGGQRISQIEHLDEVVLGSRAQGWNHTNGLVSLDFVENPSSAEVRLSLYGDISSQAYTREGPVTAYTSTSGFTTADRNMRVNVGNVTVDPATAHAEVYTRFLGTDRIPLIDRIAYRQFSKKQADAQRIASQRARDRTHEQFSAQTDQALGDGMDQLQGVRDRRQDFFGQLLGFRKDFSEILAENEDGTVDEMVEMVDSFVLPRMFVTTTDDLLNVEGVLEGDNRLAAPSAAPGKTVAADFRLQVHESMISNLIAPLIQDRLLQNWQFGRIADGLSSGAAEIPTVEDERQWAIRFEDGRPIEFVFDENQFTVRVYGKEFRQENRRYTDPLNITIPFRVVNDGGKLKLIRSGKAVAEFTYPPEADRPLPPESIAFRQFLQDNLDAALGEDPMNQAIELPANLIPLDSIEDEQLKRQLVHARLVEFSSDDGWLTLGWNFEHPDRYMPETGSSTPAIWPSAAE